LNYQNISWNPEIEYLRGIAILFIIAIHTTSYLTEMNSHNFLFYFNAAVNVFSHIGVPIFVFISGFVLALRYRDHFPLKEFYLKRIPKIVIPYLTFSVLYLSMYFFLSSSQLLKNQRELSQLTFNDVVFRMISGNAHYHLWFFILILELYFFYPLIIKIYDFFSKLHGEIQLLLFLFIIQEITSVLNYYYPATDLFFLVILNYIFYFVLGVYLSDNYSKFNGIVLNLKSTTLWSLFVLTLIFTIILMFIFIQYFTLFSGFPNPLFGYYALYFIFTLILLFSLITTIEQSEIIPLKNSLKSLSKYSFGIYLIHPFFIEATYYLVMPKLAINVNNWISYPILFFSGLIFSVIVLKILGRIPHLSIFLGIK
jgi:surface polysaccharide O-acyltransferase-like enzyme